ncbi:MAG: hypothetical protein OXE75_12430 [bacterium]|nr:hypothetical protein [bacterium]
MPVRINSNVPGRRGAASSPERRLRVPLGHLVATRAVDRQLLGQAEGRAFVMVCLRRHAGGDWGELDDHDAEANDLATVTGARVLSSYLIPGELRQGAAAEPDSGPQLREVIPDERLWIITEAEDSQGNRSQTTVLFPSDY